MVEQVAPHDLISIFATNVRTLRERMGLTQEQLATKIGAHAPYISALENGKKTPWVKNLAPLAEALNTTPDRLLRPPKKSA